MQGGEASVQPGITDQGGEPIHALQHRRHDTASAHRQHSRIFRFSAQVADPSLLQGPLQGRRRQFGCTTPAGHLRGVIHRRVALEHGHEAGVNRAFPAPQQRMGTETMGPPQAPGGWLPVLEAPQQLQGLALRRPRLQRLTLERRLQIACQRHSGPDGPDPRWSAGMGVQYGAVSCGEDMGLSKHLKGVACAQAATAGAAGQSARGQPGRRLAAGAEQSRLPLGLRGRLLVVMFNQFNRGLAERSLERCWQAIADGLEFQRAFRPALSQGQDCFHCCQATAHHPEGCVRHRWRGHGEVLLLQECQCCFQGFDGYQAITLAGVVRVTAPRLRLSRS